MTVLSGNSRDDEDAAAVIAILTLLSSDGAAVVTGATSAWGDPAYALGVRNSWWAAGLPQNPSIR